jgi:hypothetical protein
MSAIIGGASVAGIVVYLSLGGGRGPPATETDASAIHPAATAPIDATPPVDADVDA